MQQYSGVSVLLLVVRSVKVVPRNCRDFTTGMCTRVPPGRNSYQGITIKYLPGYEYPGMEIAGPRVEAAGLTAVFGDHEPQV
eukprot:2308599-Rhodomonas_salina.1